MHLFVLIILFFQQPRALSSAQLFNDQPSFFEKEIVVGISHYPPYIIKEENDQWHGISVALWRRIAEELQLEYTFREIDREATISLIREGTIDLALCVDAIPEDANKVDFSHIYHAATLGVAGHQSRSLVSIAKAVFTMRFFSIVLWISAILGIVGILIWVIERKSNEENFGGKRNPLQGIGAGFWWAGVTMTTIGYGDKAPVTFLGRTLALLWMLLAMAITSSLTATIVSAVGMGKSGTIAVPEDLRFLKTGTVQDTPSAQYLQQERIQFQSYGTAQDGLEALQNHEIEAFVQSTPVLRNAVNENAHLTAKVESTGVNPQYFVMAFPKESAVLDTINQVMLQHMNSTHWQDILNRYIPKPRQP